MADVLAVLVRWIQFFVAPDLGFSLDTGETRNLKDYRGTNMALLVCFTPASSDRLHQLAQVYPALRAAGVEVVGLPVGMEGRGMNRRARASIPFPVAWDAGDDVGIAYGLFQRGVTAEDLPDRPPRHMELLIDRQGYLRARWIMRDGWGWGDVARLLAVVRELGREPPRAPAPEAHVH
jgi:putative copper resistance protein D